MRQAVILAGGKGTRLAERLNGLPKPLVDVLGRPLLDRQLDALASYGITDVVVLVNHAADQIEAFIRQRADKAPRVTLVDDGDPRGTAGAVLACADILAEEFLVVYGDTLFDIDLDHFWVEHTSSKADVSIFLHPNDHPHDSDLVELDETGKVTAFRGYPHPEGAEYGNLVNAALYIIKKSALEPWLDNEGLLDFAKDLFPKMLDRGVSFHGHVSFEYIKDLGTPKRLDKVTRHLQTGVVERSRRSTLQKAVFLDRDGTLNVLDGYIREPSQLNLITGAGEAVHRLNDAEYRVAVVTNQPVIARGECTPQGLRKIHARLETLLGYDGAYIDALYHCPHHPDGGFAGEVAELKVKCDCRKPSAGMVLSATEQLNVDLSQSWIVGDSTADVAMANALEIPAVLVMTGEGGRDGKCPAHADHVCKDINEAALLISSVIPDAEKLVSDIARQIKPGSLVVIGGLSRSGKSVVATALRRLLSRQGPAMSVSLDRWLKPVSNRGSGVMERYDLDSARSSLEGWLAGAELKAVLPRYNRITRETGFAEASSLPKQGTLIVEGVPALVGNWKTSRPVTQIFVVTDDDLRNERLISDICGRYQVSEDEALSVVESRKLDEDVIIADTKKLANYIINTSTGVVTVI